MSTKCDCNDPECAICGARPRTGSTAFVDPYLAAKAEQDRLARAAATVQPVPPMVVHVAEVPIVAQLATAWTPPKADPVPDVVPPPLTPEQIALREQQLNEALGVTPAAPRTRTPKAQSAFAAAYTAWQAECVKRNEWIDSLYQELVKRQRARQEAIAGWDAHVAEAKRAWQNGRATLPPPAPRKEQFQG